MSHSHVKTSATYIVPEDRFGQRVPVLLSYHSNDPLAVSATIGEGDDIVFWILGRDKLFEGLTNSPIFSATPSADVATWVSYTGEYVLRLSSPFGVATLAFPLSDVNQFLYNTTLLVKQDQEYSEADIDTALADFFKNTEI